MKRKAKLTSPFDPLQHGFVLLPGHRPAGADVQFYEYRNHDSVDGKPDYYRLNIYLSRDGPFVNIWAGALDHIRIEAMLRKHGLEATDYDERLFRGYIESIAQARHILAALRIDRELPQTFRADPTKGICCEAIPAKGSSKKGGVDFRRRRRRQR